MDSAIEKAGSQLQNNSFGTFQVFTSISGAPRAREARAERSTMGKKIW